jgi:N-acetylmuramoyl-L-alanine amidase
MKLQKPIKNIVVHSSATPKDRDHTEEDIERWHKRKGWKDTGYHFIVLLDGIVESGRPITERGAHTRGHNHNTIGVCYIGGTDQSGKAMDTRTPAQKEKMRQLLSELLAVYPGANIVGHRDLAATACPSFDAKSEYANLKPRI